MYIYLIIYNFIIQLFFRFLRHGHEKREKWVRFVQTNRNEDTWLPSEHTVGGQIIRDSTHIYIIHSINNFMSKQTDLHVVVLFGFDAGIINLIFYKWQHWKPAPFCHKVQLLLNRLTSTENRSC